MRLKYSMKLSNLVDTHELNIVYRATDYDSVEMIVEQVGKYRLPDEDARKFGELSAMMKKLDWDGMEKMFADKG